MLNLEDEVYENHGGQGLLIQLGKYFLLTVIGLVLMALPCYVVGLIILSGD